MVRYNSLLFKQFLFLLFAICLGIECFVSFPSYSLDDCYITYRYAYNLFHHQQFVFNLGEKILGTTTPLYTLILAGLQFFSDEIPRISHFISFMSASLAGFLLFCILRKDNFPIGVFCAICFPFILHDIGFETNFLIFLFTLSLFLFTQDRYFMCSVILGLCFLTRQDSATFIATMLLIYWLKNRKLPWKEFLVFSITIAPWFMFSYFYFGSLFPTSFHVKGGSTSFIQYFTSALWYLARYCDHYNFYLFSFISQELTKVLSPADLYQNDIFQISLVIVFIALMLVELLYYIKNVRRYHYTGALFYLYPLLMITTLSFIAPPPQHKWHLTSAIAFALVGQLNFVTAPFLLLRNKYYSSFLQKSIGSVCSIIVICLYLLYFTSLNIKDFYSLTRDADELFWYGARHYNYEEIANFLHDTLSDEETVFVSEVGVIGYYSKKTIMDGAGLISPDCNLYYRKGCWLMCVEKKFPDYIVARVSSIPYYNQVFDYQNNFGAMFVFKKSKALPENNYPFSFLIQTCNEQNLKKRSKRTMTDYWEKYILEPAYGTTCDDDIDCDGVPDDDDNCLRVPNGPQLGTCSSGIINTCVNYEDCGEGGVCSNNQEDADKDFFGDVCDNCSEITNRKQEDIDEDKIGDVCDNCTDTDWDGYGNPGFSNTCREDNCPYTFNPDQEDGDEDGIGDICEPLGFEEHRLEAEHAETIVSPLEVADDINASKGKYIYAPEATENQYTPSFIMATYKVNISQAGTYILWGRVHVSSIDSNSFFVQIDEGSDNLWEMETGDYWYWDTVSKRGGTNSVKFILTKGVHTIKIKLREHSTKLDSLVLTNNLRFNLAKQRNVADAIEQYKKKLAINPNDIKSRHNVATIYLAKGMLDEAIYQYKKILARNPNHGESRANLGVAYYQQDRLEEAIEEFEKALTINPDYGDVHHNLSFAYYYKKNYKLALLHCDRAQELGFRVSSRLLAALKPYR